MYTLIKRLINGILGLFHLKIAHPSESLHGQNYITRKETIKNSKLKNQSVCDYVEEHWNQIGETAIIIERMKKYNVFNIPNPIICEIGAGTGRYMEKVLELCKPSRYESYEIAKDWSNWLKKQYPIVSLPADGHSLKSTLTNSIDLVHSHGVFVYIPFLDTIRYFIEIDRVTKKGSYIVFDCITEDCLDEESLKRWIDSESCYPRLMLDDYVYKYFPKKIQPFRHIFYKVRTG